MNVITILGCLLLSCLMHGSYGQKSYTPKEISYLSSLGASWSKIVSSRNGSVILAATSSASFYVSKDATSTWNGWAFSPAYIKSTSAIGMDSTGKYMVFCGYNASGFSFALYSSDYGANSYIFENTYLSYGINSVAVTDKQAYYLASTGGLYKFFYFRTYYEFYNCCPSGNVADVVSSADSDIVYANCGTTIVRSTGGGLNFQMVFDLTGTSVITSMATDRDGQHVTVFAVANKNIYFSADQGSSWKSIMATSADVASMLYTVDGSISTMLIPGISTVLQATIDNTGTVTTVGNVADGNYYVSQKLIALAATGMAEKIYVMYSTGVTMWQSSSSDTEEPTLMPSQTPSQYTPPTSTSSFPTIATTPFPTSPILFNSPFPTLSPVTTTPSLSPTQVSFTTTFPTVPPPTMKPTVIPSERPTVTPTLAPTQPTSQPTSHPTADPTRQPSAQPTTRPSGKPSSHPSLQPTAQPTNPTSQPTNQPSSQPTSRPTGIPYCNPGDYFDRENVPTTSTYLCHSCPAGTASPGGQVLSCTPCPAGSYAPTNSSSVCALCPLNFYSNLERATECAACPAGSITGATGTLTVDQCVNPSINFILGFVALGCAMAFLFIYVIRGRLHRAAFFRRKLLIRKCLLLYGIIMNIINTTQVICKQIFDIDEVINKPHHSMKSSYYGSDALRHIAFGGLAVAMIIAVVIFSIAKSLMHVIFSALVMWRTYAYLLLTRNYGFLDRMQDLLTRIDISLPYRFDLFSYLFYPIVYVVNFFANINLNLNTINVSCAGAQAPVFLLVDCVIIGVVIIIIESDMQVLWSTTLKGMISRFYGLLLNRVYLFNNLGTSFFFGSVVLAIQSLPDPRKILQYSLSLVSISYFFRVNGRSPSDANCDNVSEVPFDTILAISTSVVTYLLIPAMVYLFSQILVPYFNIPGLRRSIHHHHRNSDAKLSESDASARPTASCCSYDNVVYTIKLYCSCLLRYLSVFITLDWYYIRFVYAIGFIIYEYIEGFLLNLYTNKVKLNQNIRNLKARYDSIRQDGAFYTPNPMGETSLRNLMASRSRSASRDTLQIYERGRVTKEFTEVATIFSAPLRSVHQQHLASQEEIEEMSRLFRDEIPMLSWFYAKEYYHTNVHNQQKYESLPTTTPNDDESSSKRFSVTLSSGKVTTLHDYYEKADWNEKREELPSYFQFITRIMEDLVTNGVNGVLAIAMSFNPLSQICSELGRLVWFRVIQNYLIFVLTSVGIWNHRCATNYNVVEKYYEYTQLTDLYPEVSETLRRTKMEKDSNLSSNKQDNSAVKPTPHVSSKPTIQTESETPREDPKLVEEDDVELTEIAHKRIENNSHCEGNNCLSNDDSMVDDGIKPQRSIEIDELRWSQIHSPVTNTNTSARPRKVTPLMQSNAAVNDIIFSDYLSAIVSSRVVLLQLLPFCTIWSIFAVDLAGCPLFVFDEEMQSRLPDLIAWDAYSKAIDLYCALYQLTPEQYHEIMHITKSTPKKLTVPKVSSIDAKEEETGDKPSIRVQTLAEFSELHADKYDTSSISAFQVKWKIVLLSIYVFFKQSRLITFLRIASLDACATLIIFFPSYLNHIVEFLASIVIIDAVLNAIYALILVHKFFFPNTGRA